MTSSNGNIFRVTGHLCGEFTGHGEFHTQRPVTRSFDVFLNLRLNKRLSKQSWGWWFETLSCLLWRHRNGILFAGQTKYRKIVDEVSLCSCGTLGVNNVLAPLQYVAVICMIYVINNHSGCTMYLDYYFEHLLAPWALRWRHNGCNGLSNHQPHGCLLNSLFGRRSKKTSKFRVTGLCAGNSPGTGEFPAHMASNAENVSIWWRHHEMFLSSDMLLPYRIELGVMVLLPSRDMYSWVNL